MRSSFTCLTTIVLLLGACPAGDDGDTNGATDPGTGTDPATTDPATTDPVTTDPVTTDPVTTDPVTTDPVTTDPSETESSPTTTDPSTDPTESSGPDPDTGTETGGGDVCAAEDDDTPCQACIKTECCMDLETCQAADANCACVLDCLGAMKNPGVPEAMQCGVDCGADFGAIVAPLLAVQACRDMNCSDQKGCPAA